MSTRAERIKLLIENSGKSYQELERITGIKKSSLQRYASGATAKIPLDVIEKLSITFNVSKEYLMGWEDSPELNLQLFAEKNSPDQIELTEREKKILEVFRLIPVEQQDAFLEMGRLYANSLKKD